jgi:hypothetical protein
MRREGDKCDRFIGIREMDRPKSEKEKRPKDRDDEENRKKGE